MDRYSVRAKIESISNNGIARLVVYFADNTTKNQFGSLASSNKNNIYKNEICSFEIDLKEIDSIKEYVHAATVVGFNVDVGVVIQILSSDKKGDPLSSFEYTITFTDKEKDAIRSDIAKAHLLNKT